MSEWMLGAMEIDLYIDSSELRPIEILALVHNNVSAMRKDALKHLMI